MNQTTSAPEATEFEELPQVPVWAVGADAQHTGPSGMGPGVDRPGSEPGREEDAKEVAGSGRNGEGEGLPGSLPTPTA